MLSIDPPEEPGDEEVDDGEDDDTDAEADDEGDHELKLPPLGTATVSPTVIMLGLLSPELAASRAARETP